MLKLQSGTNTKCGWQDHRTLREIRPLSPFHHGKYLLDGTRLRRERLGRKAMLREMLGAPIPPRRFGHRATRDEFATYYKFAVVRNPWARVYSWYRNVQCDPRHHVPTCYITTFLTEHADNWALRPQLYRLEDFDGSIPLDKIVRFEILADAMREMFDHLGFSSPARSRLSV